MADFHNCTNTAMEETDGNCDYLTTDFRPSNDNFDTDLTAKARYESIYSVPMDAHDDGSGMDMDELGYTIINSDTPTVDAVAAEIQTEEPISVKKYQRKSLIAIGVLVLFGVGIGVGYYIFISVHKPDSNLVNTNSTITTLMVSEETLTKIDTTTTRPTVDVTEVSNYTPVFYDTPMVVFGGFGFTLGQLNRPVGVAVDSLAGVIYVADRDNNRVCSFTMNGAPSNCQVDISTGDDLETFQKPRAVNVISSSELVLADSNRVLLLQNMTLVRQWGSKVAGVQLGEFSVPLSVNSDANRLLYVADRNNARIQILSLDGTPSVHVIGLGTLEEPTNAVVSQITGQMYVTDKTLKQVIVFNRTGELLTKLTGSDFKTTDEEFDPRSVTVDKRGQIYVGDYNKNIHILSPGHHLIQTLACCFRSPVSMAVNDISGELIVADHNNHKIHIHKPLYT